MIDKKLFALKSGNHLIAEGAYKAGCRAFFGYPITPASDVFREMITMLTSGEGIALSAPDEITSLCYCIGASMKGVKSMTATSGPGWCLMIESVQYAIMTETPVVIVIVQRLGPSTGSATQGAQGDIFLAEYASSGGYTIPMFCPSNPYECYEMTIHAFNWSEKLRTPVIVLTDKEVGMTYESVDYNQLPDVPIINRKYFEGSDNYKPYDYSYIYDVPDFIPVGSHIKVTATGSTHNKSGFLKKNDPESLEVLLHLEEKIIHHAREMEMVNYDFQEASDILLISYGITARACMEAVRRLRDAGIRISFLKVYTLFPIPEEALVKALDGIHRVYIAEENLMGLYARALAPLLHGKNICRINKIGALISPEEIIKKIRETQSK